ncbi:MAG: nucleotidyl transferase AbiEii/AbiGii toxin family protein [Bacilli bacterium]|nr:nucleotidyl transferase AbiEii/AbiGii toxin family protein [Bacilli bacterium]
MNKQTEMMLSKYNPSSLNEKENAIKEVLQELVLSAFSKTDFFNKAAFYGGTCLRIFHGLNRFSEDLDFALMDRNVPFDLSSYFPSLEKTFESFGIKIDVSVKEKSKESGVQSAFLKGNTATLLFYFFDKDGKSLIPSNQRIRIKFEVDTNNPPGGIVKKGYKLLPTPYQVTVFDETTLFAGKIAALICRNYQNRVKGRDYYDYLFYLSKGTKINFEYLQNKLKDSGVIDDGSSLSLEQVKELLRERFEKTDYSLAVLDVQKFIKDQDELSLWSKELFLATLDELK